MEEKDFFPLRGYPEELLTGSDAPSLVFQFLLRQLAEYPLGEALRVEDAASFLGKSTRTLQQDLKQVARVDYSMVPLDFRRLFHYARFTAVLYYLQGGQPAISVAVISQTMISRFVGYGMNPSAISRMFKKWTGGYPPTEWSTWKAQEAEAYEQLQKGVEQFKFLVNEAK